MYTVYALLDPRDDSIRYIGLTATDVHRRLQRHLKETDINPAKIAWIRELRELNLTPIPWELEHIEEQKQAVFKEKFWINFCLFGGEPLLNITDTENKPTMKRGNAGRVRTDEEVNAMLDEYERTGKRPAGWTRQALWAIKKSRGVR